MLAQDGEQRFGGVLRHDELHPAVGGAAAYVFGGADDGHPLAAAFARHTEGAPGLAFYLAGADPHENDRLGRLKISSEGLAERDRRVLKYLRARRVPVALSMAGGYGRELHTTVAVQRRTLELALESWQLWRGAAQAVEESAA